MKFLKIILTLLIRYYRYLILRTSRTTKGNYLNLNWGTKWDVSELDIEYVDDEILELTFNTAWSPPEGVMQELKDRYPDLGFTCFYDEPGMEAAGYY